MALRLWLTHLQELLPGRMADLLQTLHANLPPTMHMLDHVDDLAQLETRYKESADLLTQYVLPPDSPSLHAN
jgi:hypothetical protein